MKEAIGILTKEMLLSQHFASYPQDRHKDKEVTIEILITTSKYHAKRAKDFAGVIEFLNSKPEK